MEDHRLGTLPVVVVVSNGLNCKMSTPLNLSSGKNMNLEEKLNAFIFCLWKISQEKQIFPRCPNDYLQRIVTKGNF